MIDVRVDDLAFYDLFTRGADGYSAHAWLDGDPDGNGFVELLRRPPA